MFITLEIYSNLLNNYLTQLKLNPFIVPKVFHANDEEKLQRKTHSVVPNKYKSASLFTVNSFPLSIPIEHLGLMFFLYHHTYRQLPQM